VVYVGLRAQRRRRRDALMFKFVDADSHDVKECSAPYFAEAPSVSVRFSEALRRARRRPTVSSFRLREEDLCP
jgi:hypothetical protein